MSTHGTGLSVCDGAGGIYGEEVEGDEKDEKESVPRGTIVVNQNAKAAR